MDHALNLAPQPLLLHEHNFCAGDQAQGEDGSLVEIVDPRTRLCRVIAADGSLGLETFTATHYARFSKLKPVSAPLAEPCPCHTHSEAS